MALPDKHPQYVERLGEWIQMADTFAGERAVKSKRLDYLPATEGMVADGMQTPTAPGWKDYEAYLLRAYFHDIIKDGVKAMIGIMHAKPAVIELPAKLEPMMENATVQGEGLQQLLRRINVNQLVKGRLGLLVDVPSGKPVNEAMPYIALYDALRIINWDAGRENSGVNDLQVVVIDETGMRREGLTWKSEQKYRILTRGGFASLDDSTITPPDGWKYSVAVKINNTSMPGPDDFMTPSLGGVELDKIPFVFIGANDLVPEPEVPPLLGLSNLALAIYRAEADYRQTLFMQGQATLVIVGGAQDETNTGTLRTGAKGVIDLRIGGDAFYIGVPADGLSEMRQSLQRDQDRAAMEGVTFLDAGKTDGTQQSGEALRIRVAARTTTIASVAKAGGLGLEMALKFAARWVGANPDEVKVKPITDFADQTVAGAALLAFMQAKQLGLPLSLKSLHQMMSVNNMTEMTFDQENDQIEDEAESMLGAMVGPQMQQVGDGFLTDPNDPNASPAGDEAPTPGQPLSGPASKAPKAQTTPVTPHVRGSPSPLKKKLGKKGASAGK